MTVRNYLLYIGAQVHTSEGNTRPQTFSIMKPTVFLPNEIWEKILKYANDGHLKDWLLERKDDYIRFLEDRLHALQHDVERAVTHLVQANEETRLEV